MRGISATRWRTAPIHGFPIFCNRSGEENAGQQDNSWWRGGGPHGARISPDMAVGDPAVSHVFFPTVFAGVKMLEHVSIFTRGTQFVEQNRFNQGFTRSDSGHVQRRCQWPCANNSYTSTPALPAPPAFPLQVVFVVGVPSDRTSPAALSPAQSQSIASPKPARPAFAHAHVLIAVHLSVGALSWPESGLSGPSIYSETTVVCQPIHPHGDVRISVAIAICFLNRKPSHRRVTVYQFLSFTYLSSYLAI